MNSTVAKDREGRDYWMVAVCRSYLVERDSHVAVEVAGTGKAAVV